nr:hypothetical protein [Desulfobacterales bacterium]
MRNIIKSANARQDNTFRLHYFPNIPAKAQGVSKKNGNDAAPEETSTSSSPESTVEQQIKPGIGHANGLHNPLMDKRAQREAMARQAYAEGFAQGERDAKVIGEERMAPLM